MRRAARAVIVLSLALEGAACRRSSDPAHAPIDAATREGAVSGASPADAGAYVVDPSVLDRFIAYQVKALPLQGELLAALARMERADAGHEAATALLARHADALERLRVALGLTMRDVSEIEAIVGDVIARRSASPPGEAEETIRELQALAARLPEEQRAEFDATIEALRKEHAASADLDEERRRHGELNVARVLEREAELTAQWNRAVALFAGVRRVADGDGGR